MKIAVIGATGTIGSKIAAELEKRGHEVVPISITRGRCFIARRFKRGADRSGCCDRCD